MDGKLINIQEGKLNQNKTEQKIPVARILDFIYKKWNNSNNTVVNKQKIIQFIKYHQPK